MRLIALLALVLGQALVAGCGGGEPRSRADRDVLTRCPNPALEKGLETGDGDAKHTTPDSFHSERERARVPLRAAWVVKAATLAELVLVARVERLAPLGAPLELFVEVPAQVTLISGAARETIPGSEATGALERELAFRIKGVPAGDIVLNARVEGEGFGMHAKDAYSFARVRAAPRSPRAGGTRLVLGGRDFGASVPLLP